MIRKIVPIFAALTAVYYGFRHLLIGVKFALFAGTPAGMVWALMGNLFFIGLQFYFAYGFIRRKRNIAIAALCWNIFMFLIALANRPSLSGLAVQTVCVSIVAWAVYLTKKEQRLDRTVPQAAVDHFKGGPLWCDHCKKSYDLSWKICLICARGLQSSKVSP